MIDPVRSDKVLYKHIFFTLFFVFGLGPPLYVVIGEELGFSHFSEEQLVDYSFGWAPLFGFTLCAWLYIRKDPKNVIRALKKSALMALFSLCSLIIFFNSIWPFL